MNYLAHLFLSKDTDYSKLGNFLGDFARGNREKLLNLYHPEIVEGIITHRNVDKFTDNHEETKKAISVIKYRHRLFSGIIIDVLFDHFLSIHWSTFSDIDRQIFINDCHQALSIDIPNLPENFRRFLPILKEYDILDSYFYIDGVDHALYRIDQRFKRETTLCDAVTDIEKHYEELENCFLNFFPDVCAFVKDG